LNNAKSPSPFPAMGFWHFITLLLGNECRFARYTPITDSILQVADSEIASHPRPRDGGIHFLSPDSLEQSVLVISRAVTLIVNGCVSSGSVGVRGALESAAVERKVRHATR
jgi:hypothetical protein